MRCIAAWPAWQELDYVRKSLEMLCAGAPREKALAATAMTALAKGANDARAIAVMGGDPPPTHTHTCIHPHTHVRARAHFRTRAHTDHYT